MKSTITKYAFAALLPLSFVEIGQISGSESVQNDFLLNNPAEWQNEGQETPQQRD